MAPDADQKAADRIRGAVQELNDAVRAGEDIGVVAHLSPRTEIRVDLPAIDRRHPLLSVYITKTL